MYVMTLEDVCSEPHRDSDWSSWALACAVLWCKCHFEVAFLLFPVIFHAFKIFFFLSEVLLD